MSPPSPAEQRLQEISHLFLSTSRAGSPPPSPLQPASATSEPRRSLPPRVIAVGSATDPFVTTFAAGALAAGLRARGRRVLLYDGVGQPWFLRQVLAIEGRPERSEGGFSLSELRRTGVTRVDSGPLGGRAGGRPPPTIDECRAAEADADFVVALLPCGSLAAYLGRFCAPHQEFLVVTDPSEEGVGGAFARLREVHLRLPEARLGVLVGGVERPEAEACFARLARASGRFLGAAPRSYGWYGLTARCLRERAAGRVAASSKESVWRAQTDAVAALVLADGRPWSCPTTTAFFFDVPTTHGVGLP